MENIIALVQWEVKYNFALMQQFSAVVTTAGLMTNAVYPNLTMNEFEITGGKLSSTTPSAVWNTCRS